MKAITAVCATGASVPAIINGRVARHRDGENAEIQMYLSKLKDLVPFMPKNRKLSKLEIIQHVIDYICDLQKELESHPEVDSFDAAAALDAESQTQQLENLIAGSQNASPSSSPACYRQPLSDRSSPNTILSSQHSSSSSSSSLFVSAESANLHSSSSHTVTDKRDR